MFNAEKQLVVLTSLGDSEVSLLNDDKWHIYSNTNDLISDRAYFHKYAYNENISIELKKHNLVAGVFEGIQELKNIHEGTV